MARPQPIIPCILLAVCLPAGALTAAVGGQVPAPPQASAVGYALNTFSSTFTTAQVDAADSRASGFRWYRSRYFGYGAATGIRLNADSSVTLSNNGGANMGLLSAGATANGGWIGTVFGGGGYFEAVLKFDPRTVNTAQGWPSWWSMPIESSVNLPGMQWHGQVAGYRHNVEPDFFEYLVPDYGTPAGKSYGGGMHDWSGVYPNMVNKTPPWPKGVITTPSTTDFNQYHRFGWLWVPATATVKGYATFYFDGQATTNSVSWTQFVDQQPTAPTSLDPWTFGVLDQQHLILILGTAAPMTVQSVNVWQKSDLNNGHDGKLPVTIAIPPANQSVNAGNPATFTVVAYGTPNPTWKWQRSNDGGTTWSDIAGATAASYTIPATARGDNGARFRCVAGNSVGSVPSAAATLTVASTGTNHPPSANAQGVTTAEDTAKAITLVATDADGDALSYAIVANPAHGSLAGSGASRTYTPAANFSGSDSFTFKANDGSADSGIATVSITVTAVNDAPVVSTASATPSPVTGTTANLSATASDVDDAESTLTYTWSASGPAAVLFGPNATNPAKASTATFSMAGAYTFTVTAKDPAGATGTRTISVTVAQIGKSLSISPTGASVQPLRTVDFNAILFDQFDAAMATQPVVSWTVSGGGTMDANGLFTAGSGTPSPSGGITATTYAITATSGGQSATALVTVSAASGATASGWAGNGCGAGSAVGLALMLGLLLGVAKFRFGHS